MNVYRITKLAESDLEEIYLHVAKYNRSAANRLLDLLFDGFSFWPIHSRQELPATIYAKDCGSSQLATT